MKMGLFSITGILNSLFRLFVRTASLTDPHVRFELHDPSHTPHSPKLLEELIDFRNKAYLKRSPLLAQKFSLHQSEEQAFDEKSIHAIARHRRTAKIVAAVRFTPETFELEKLAQITPPLAAEEKNLTLEISRLISDADTPFIGRKLLFIGGEHIWSQTPYRNLIGICRPDRLPLFESFGVKQVRPQIWIEERQSHYYIIAGRLSDVISAVRGAFTKRLKEYFFK